MRQTKCGVTKQVWINLLCRDHPGSPLSWCYLIPLINHERSRNLHSGLFWERKWSWISGILPVKASEGRSTLNLFVAWDSLASFLQRIGSLCFPFSFPRPMDRTLTPQSWFSLSSLNEGIVCMHYPRLDSAGFSVFIILLHHKYVLYFRSESI